MGWRYSYKPPVGLAQIAALLMTFVVSNSVITLSKSFRGGSMSCRSWFLATIHLSSLFLLSGALTFAEEPTTPDQVIAMYKEATGANRFSSITTFAERGDFYGDLTSQDREHGTFEFYFKSPNFRFSSHLDAKKRVIALHGCDGRMAWYIDAHLKRTEVTPKPGSEFDCEKGFESTPSRLRDASAKMRLVRKKEVEGRIAWEISVDDRKSQGPTTYYFDAETYVLLRVEMLGSRVTYSDYRAVGGIKFPFKTTSESKTSRLETTVRELVINDPIEDARFAEPNVKDGAITLNSVGGLKADDAETANIGSPKATSTATDTLNIVSSEISPTPKAASVTEVNFPNFTLCTIAELQQTVPELKGLKPASDQLQLSALLDKVGAKTVEIARNTPNLISRETVTELQQGAAETRYDYDYLVLTRIEGNAVGLDEFRLDLKTGDKFQTDEALKNKSSMWAAVERASHELATSKSGRQPNSQGFAASWVHFYPLNRPRATFRYLGEQKMDGHRTLVLAFAQKPQSVVSPARFLYQGKTVPMFLQGVAWVNASDFRILRLRTDLLSPLPEVSLHRLTADIQFEPTRIEELSSLLSLPREVNVTSEVSGSTLREIHRYSEYRLFRARSRIVLNQ
jgi:hypothetical protein